MGVFSPPISHSAPGWKACIQRVTREENVSHGCNIGLENQITLRLNIKVSVGVDSARNSERLPATDFHVARAAHGKLEDGNVRQLDILPDARHHILNGVEPPGIRNHGDRAYVSLQARVSRIEVHVVGKRSDINEGPVYVAASIVKLPIRPGTGIGNGQDDLAVGS